MKNFVVGVLVGAVLFWLGWMEYANGKRLSNLEQFAQQIIRASQAPSVMQQVPRPEKAK